MQIRVDRHRDEPGGTVPPESDVAPQNIPGLSEATHAEISDAICQGTYEGFEKALAALLPASISNYEPTRLTFKPFIEKGSFAVDMVISCTLYSETMLRDFLRALIHEVALNAAYTPAALVIIRYIQRQLKDETPSICGRLVHPLSTILNQDLRQLEIAWARFDGMYRKGSRFNTALSYLVEIQSFSIIIGTYEELTQNAYYERLSNVKDLMMELCDLGIVRLS